MEGEKTVVKRVSFEGTTATINENALLEEVKAENPDCNVWRNEMHPYVVVPFTVRPIQESESFDMEDLFFFGGSSEND